MVDIVERLNDDAQCFCSIRKEAADEIERLREALGYCACVCEKPCGKHLEQNGEKIFVQCTGWIARSALQQKDSE